MELIEAIYLSVGLFAIAVIIILIISFTSYKVKKKLGNNKNEKEITHELKPKLKSKNGKQTKPSKPRPKLKETKKLKVRKEIQPEVRIKKEIRKTHSTKKNVLTKTSQPRIEVLNTNVEIEKAPKKPSPSPNPKAIKKNVFDHYSENSDDEFKSLTDNDQ